jgi:hypothetical protein
MSKSMFNNTKKSEDSSKLPQLPEIKIPSFMTESKTVEKGDDKGGFGLFGSKKETHK